MTALEAVAAIVGLIVQAFPEISADVEKLVADWKDGHPELGSAPPVDEESAIHAEIDARIKPSA